MKIGSIVIVVWLVIGALASLQRGYFSDDSKTSCAEASTILVTILAGPLNYVGVNPTIDDCDVPEPSR